MRTIITWLLLTSLAASCQTQPAKSQKLADPAKPVVTGAERLTQYLHLIKGKRVAVFANPTSMVGSKHLVDTLQKSGVSIQVIFGPEHGFRGDADAGEKVGNYVDEATGIPVVSLYGAKRLPDANDLKEVDVMIFDIQDVGTRFYTYISSLEDYIQAGIEHKKTVLILDRPNPNGHYVDGPVLQMPYKSFIGRQQIPVVYGLTIAEYAQYLLGEKLIKGMEGKFVPAVIDGAVPNSYPETPHIEVHLIRCENYDHRTMYDLPVKPSPNLPNIQSIYLYPSTCFFEGTVLSEGRGTSKPFQVFGHPSLPDSLFAFTPNPNEGAKNSKNYGKLNYGWDLSGTVEEVLAKVDNKVQLKWLMEAYRLFPQKDSFFILPKSGSMEQSFFNKLAGNDELWRQIKAGKSEAEIRASWEPALTEFREKRKKYLLYAE